MKTSSHFSPLLPRCSWPRSFVLVLGREDPAPSPAQTCVGDCNGDGRVLVNELVLGVNIVLEERPVSACTALADEAGIVNIMQMMKGINNALGVCPARPTATPTATPVPRTPTPTPSLTATLPSATPTTTRTLPPTATSTAPATATPTTAASNTATPSVTATTAPALCGDGFVNLAQGETCDDGNTADGDSCPANCRIEKLRRCRRKAR